MSCVKSNKTVKVGSKMKPEVCKGCVLEQVVCDLNLCDKTRYNMKKNMPKAEVICEKYSKERCPVCSSWNYRKKYAHCFDCGAWFASIKTDLYHNHRETWYKCRKLNLL